MSDRRITMAQLGQKAIPELRREEARQGAAGLRAEEMHVLPLFPGTGDKCEKSFWTGAWCFELDALVLLFVKLFLGCGAVAVAFVAVFGTLAAFRLLFGAFFVSESAGC